MDLVELRDLLMAEKSDLESRENKISEALWFMEQLLLEKEVGHDERDNLESDLRTILDELEIEF